MLREVAVREKRVVAADGVVGGWCVDGFLHVTAIEVVVWTLRWVLD